MVRNTGGNGAKKMASKDFKSTSNKLRVIEQEGEHYAIVTKMLGNGLMNVITADSVMRLCVIRGKFKGKGKSSNMIGLGSWVLVGERTWESKEKKLPSCDLVEVYTALERERLKTIIPDEVTQALLKNDPTNVMTITKESGNLSFMSQKQIDYLDTMERAIKSESKAIEFSTDTIIASHVEEEVIDVSDI